ncbi:MAG: Uma2 family endonuclease [Pseudonocardiaceae bacterium]
MTALPQPPTHLLTVAEYAQLGETTTGYTELQEGNLIISPSSSPRVGCCCRCNPNCLTTSARCRRVDIDLELAFADQAEVVRRPDLVVDHKALDQVDRDGGLLRASDVLVVVEIVSPGSQRLDHVVKRHEYADARVGHYWIVDLDEPVTLLDCHLAGPL